MGISLVEASIHYRVGKLILLLRRLKIKGSMVKHSDIRSYSVRMTERFAWEMLGPKLIVKELLVH